MEINISISFILQLEMKKNCHKGKAYLLKVYLSVILQQSQSSR